MEDIRLRFGNALRKDRHKLGVSQEEFADICGLDRTYIGGIERGERNVALVNRQGPQDFTPRTVPRGLKPPCSTFL
jgi:ribosome-binding protein aMBF1 (putative translation factor)